MKRWIPSFIAAVFYAAHPVHSDAVANIVGRAEILCCMFFLLSFLSFHSSIESDPTDEIFDTSPSEIEQTAFRTVSWSRFLLSLVLADLSFFSKENGITVFGIFFIYDAIALMRKLDYFKKVTRKNSAYNPLQRVLHSSSFHVIIRMGFCVLSALSLLLFRKFYIVRWQPLISFVANPLKYSPLINNVLTIPYLHAYSAYLLAFPYHLVMDYSYNCIPMIENFSDPRILLFLGFYLILISATILGLLKRKWGLLVVIYCWIVLPFLPASQILFPVGLLIIFFSFAFGFFFPDIKLKIKTGVLVGERLLYVPSLGFCFLLAMIFDQILRNKRAGFSRQYSISFKSIAGFSTVLLIFVLYSIRTWNRNKIYVSEEVLFKNLMEDCPNNARGPMFVGTVISNLKGTASANESLPYMLKSLEIYPRFAKALRHTGRLYGEMGEVENSIKYYRKCLESPDVPKQWNCHFGLIEQLFKKYKEEACDEIITLMEQAGKYANAFEGSLLNTGLCYLSKGRHKKAANVFMAYNARTQGGTPHSNAWLGDSFFSLGELERSKKSYQDALRFNNIKPSLKKHIEARLADISSKKTS